MSDQNSGAPRESAEHSLGKGTEDGGARMRPKWQRSTGTKGKRATDLTAEKATRVKGYEDRTRQTLWLC